MIISYTDRQSYVIDLFDFGFYINVPKRNVLVCLQNQQDRGQAGRYVVGMVYWYRIDCIVLFNFYDRKGDTPMITIKQFMETCGYRITEGSDFGWDCYGHNAYRLDSWNGDQDGHTVSIVFDTQTQVVYEVEAFDYSRERAYRMINPEYKAAFNARPKIEKSLTWLGNAMTAVVLNTLISKLTKTFWKKPTQSATIKSMTLVYRFP